MYRVSKTVLTKRDNPTLFEYFTENGILATNLHNAALFRVRQNFTSHGKEVLSENEKTILKEIESTMIQCHAGKSGSLMSYTFLEKLMRMPANPDFFAGIPMQSAQYVLKDLYYPYSVP